ncbi:hypothetical protein CC1G_09628 [Coprinopsis cinerea okayama7|uniref:Uncharacterized protein n=1 Tax=Coprinopsis cinerea (strain Okayama-7 / 130 / ATCC MYA-4618 / FGSC 9003) TaxID=240176 RepID=A8N4E4_COPC7|nr:hypothetical protein CC1G_09628 [Coprinopsis cinerea okayama7\|eukprot:XP_001829739.1 hypothetical protein CC1G_09628 [Coprinopsis cinerea okayama7\
MRSFAPLFFFVLAASATPSPNAIDLAVKSTSNTTPIQPGAFNSSAPSIAAVTCTGFVAFNSADAFVLGDYLASQPDTAISGIPRFSTHTMAYGNARFCVPNTTGSVLNVRFNSIGNGILAIAGRCCTAATCLGGTETIVAVGESAARIPLRLRGYSESC